MLLFQMSSYTEARGTILQLNKAGHSDEAILDLYKDWNKSYDKVKTVYTID